MKTQLYFPDPIVMKTELPKMLLKGGLKGGLKAGEFENAGFSFFLDEEHFENEAFRRQCSHENDVISMLELDQ